MSMHEQQEQRALEAQKAAWKKRGVELQRLLKTDRVDTWLGMKDGQQVLVKESKRPEANLGIENAIAWNEAMRDTLAPHDWVVPQLVDRGEDREKVWVVQEWLEGTRLGNHQSLTAAPAFADKLDRVVQLIQLLDAAEPEDFCPLDDNPDASAYLAHRTELLHAVAGQAVEAGELTQASLDACVELMHELEESLEFRMQHHDIVPWHLLDLADGKLGLIDAEYGGKRVRFYDAAYTLTKLFTTVKDDTLAHRFLEGVRTSCADADVETKILIPLAFTIPREMTERMQRQDQEGLDRMRSMIHATLNKDLDRLLER